MQFSLITCKTSKCSQENIAFSVDLQIYYWLYSVFSTAQVCNILKFCKFAML